MARTLKAFIKCFMVWLLCSVPSFFTMLFIWYSDIVVEGPNIAGIEANEILIYVVSFAGPLVAWMLTHSIFSDKRPTKSIVITDIFALFILFASIALFCILKDKSSPDKFYVVFNCILVLYIASIILWLIHTYLDIPPSKSDIDKVNSKYYNGVNSELDEKLRKEAKNDRD